MKSVGGRHGKNRRRKAFPDVFEYAPISLWEQDFSAIQTFFNGLRRQGVRALGRYLDGHPGQVEKCIALIQVVDVNQQTLAIFAAYKEMVAYAAANLTVVTSEDIVEMAK